ncbi:MAG TPA: hypothetical protein VMW36_05575 [Patescibacteria group bacterium]|nr:hypothetical protein [Patescibacteria group bacterium]
MFRPTQRCLIRFGNISNVQHEIPANQTTVLATNFHRFGSGCCNGGNIENVGLGLGVSQSFGLDAQVFRLYEETLELVSAL